MWELYSLLILSILLLIILVVVVIFSYNKLSYGICKSSKHLVGKVIIVTGGNSGIGFETAKNLAERGAKVIVAARNESRGIAARDSIIASTGNQDVHYKHLDLALLKSVWNFANDIIKNETRLDILINNAGVFKVENIKTVDGLNLAMQSNHFGPFLLTCLLLPLLKTSAPSRIINVASMVYKKGVIDFDNLNLEKTSKNKYSYYATYRNSKLCNVLMTKELARRLEGTGVTANCLHPGVIDTNIIPSADMVLARMFLCMFSNFIKTSWEGAQTSIYLAVSPEVVNTSGAYFSECREAPLNKLAQNEEVARKLWEVSEHLVKLKI